MPDPLAQHWLNAVSHKDVRTQLESIYADLHDAIAARQPICQASGRCCNFESYGHRLYVTGIEAAYTVARLPAYWTQPTIDKKHIDEASARGGCPFQQDLLCSVHTIKPLGCRIYFCDPTAQDWQQDLHEQLITRVRAIHNEHDITYHYTEWRAMLEYFC